MSTTRGRCDSSATTCSTMRSRRSFSPDSRELAVEDTGNIVWVWDTCAVCENPKRLSELAAQETVRGLTPGERATFNVT